MQTRANAESDVYSSRVGNQVIRDASYKTTGRRVVNKSVIKTKYQNSRKTRQGLGRIGIRKQRVVVYNISINWLTQNRHRIRINVLTGDRQTDWSIYTLGY